MRRWDTGRATKFGWRRPQALLGVGFAVGFVWAFCFNALLGARLGVFYYGRVIPGLAIFEGTKHQYPMYDSIAMALQMMVFAYLLGRTDAQGRNVDRVLGRPTVQVHDRDVRALDRRPSSSSATSSIVAVFAPHLITKLQGDVTAGPTEQLFPGVQNQPFDGGVGGTRRSTPPPARGGGR